MAVGDITLRSNCRREICLMTGQTANTGQPTDGFASTQGVPNFPNESLYSADSGANFAVEPCETHTLIISSTAGSGTMVGTFTLWGYLTTTAKWYPINVNAGAALAELASPGDTIRFQQQFTMNNGTGLAHYDRLYLQLAAVGGTATAFEAYLCTARLQ